MAEDRNKMQVEEGQDKDPEVRRSNITDIRISHTDIVKYGTTPGCQACGCTARNTKPPAGLARSQPCRTRVREAIGTDDDAKERVARSDKRKDRSEVDEVHAFIRKSKGTKMRGPGASERLSRKSEHK